MVGIGEPAPDFEGPDSQGTDLHLASLRGKPVVLFFFPKAFTSGCTTETQRLADLYPGLSERGVHLVGISVDTPETQARFAAHCGAAFPIVSDPTRSIARSYGVLSWLGVARRVTFFIDERGIVRDVANGLLPGPHVARVKERFLGP